MNKRRLIGGAALLIVGLLVIRTAIVQSWSVRDPAAAQPWWPGHPDVQKSLAERSIARSAARGEAPQPNAFAALDGLARRAPMAIAPLLAYGVQAYQAGEAGRAKALFELAERRDGRALAPHYFLAELYLRTGNVEGGLRELVDLARLAPGGVASSAPYVSQYARDPAHWAQMRALFRSQPELASAVLGSLAADPDNLAALKALAEGANRAPSAPWIRIAINAAVAAGRYGQARALWASAAGVDLARAGLVFDPEFRDNRAPEPFNWTLTESGIGVAERAAGSGLHVLFYGSQAGTLARQLLTLGPGTYRLSIASSGRLGEPRALSWSLTCDRSSAAILYLPLTPNAPSTAQFKVPGNCPAQWLTLDGRAQDIRGDSDVTVSAVRLERVGA